MVCVSINYKKADADIRGKFAYDHSAQEKLWTLLSANGASEGVILCTCSRTEVYACGNIDISRIISLMEQLSNVEDIKQYTLIFEGRNALNHLFRVSCGMDSMILGEDEILGQTKDAYRNACENGMAGHEINITFQAAIACAKKIKTDTALSGVPVSVSTLAANEAVRAGQNILMIGAAGKIGGSTLKNLLSHKNVNITVTARKHMPDIAKAQRERVNIIPYERRYSFTDSADCVISATSSPVYTLTFENLRGSIHTEKERLFIDLAVPRDIDEKIGSVKGIKLLDIDYFERLAENNSGIKLSAKEKAEAIIADETETLRKSIAMREYILSADKIGARLAERGIQPLIYRLKSELDAEDFERFVKVLTDFGKG